MVERLHHPQHVVGVDLLDERADRPRARLRASSPSCARVSGNAALPSTCAGAALFAAAIAALMTALTYAGDDDPAHASMAGAAFVVCLLLFVAQERRAGEPMISFALWARRPIAACNGATLLSGMILMGSTTFPPMYVQGVLNCSPVIAGLALTMMMVGWPVGATLAAKVFHRIGLRRMLIAGSVFIPVGAVLLLFSRAGRLAARRRVRLAHHGLRHGHVERQLRSS